MRRVWVSVALLLCHGLVVVAGDDDQEPADDRNSFQRMVACTTPSCGSMQVRSQAFREPLSSLLPPLPVQHMSLMRER